MLTKKVDDIQDHAYNRLVQGISVGNNTLRLNYSSIIQKEATLTGGKKEVKREDHVGPYVPSRQCALLVDLVRKSQVGGGGKGMMELFNLAKLIDGNNDKRRDPQLNLSVPGSVYLRGWRAISTGASIEETFVSRSCVLEALTRCNVYITKDNFQYYVEKSIDDLRKYASQYREESLKLLELSSTRDIISMEEEKPSSLLMNPNYFL